MKARSGTLLNFKIRGQDEGPFVDFNFVEPENVFVRIMDVPPNLLCRSYEKNYLFNLLLNV